MPQCDANCRFFLPERLVSICISVGLPASLIVWVTAFLPDGCALRGPPTNQLRKFMEKPTSIAAPKGKLGVLLPGMGAVATTFMAAGGSVRPTKTQPARPLA